MISSAARRTQLYQVDAFASAPFAGNPAAVCVIDAAETRDPQALERWMQNVAMEMNLSETAFLVRLAKPGHYSLRWFTPTDEADLCGHATLASAHALWTHVGETSKELHFETRAGILSASREVNSPVTPLTTTLPKDSHSQSWIRLDFPLLPETSVRSPIEGLEKGLGGAKPVYVGEDPGRILVELESEAAVRAVKPDLAALARLGRGVAITARSADPKYDFVSRYFSAYDGIGEDPVTGSAHCLLAPFWGAKLGKTELVGYQASRRGGVVRTKVDRANIRVALFGQAVTVASIELYS